jgi:hypothetical protein
MKKHGLKVALNISKLSVSEKINRALHIVNEIASNPGVFANPIPTLADVQTAITDLEVAWNNAVDGGKTLTAIMHDKESKLHFVLNNLAAYVQGVADGDAEIVHLAAMNTKGMPVFHIPDFSVSHTDDRGAVRLRVKPKAKTIYRWEFCKDPIGNDAWQEAKTTDVCITNFGDLDEGSKYWFRVVFIGNGGESIPYEPVSIIVI